MVPLGVVDPESLQNRQDLGVLDELGDDALAHAVGHVRDRLDEDPVFRILDDIANEGPVDLDLVDR